MAAEAAREAEATATATGIQWKATETGIQWKCSSCFKRESDAAPLMVCKGCKSARYCGPCCQEQHWHAVHKKVCKKLRAIKDEGKRLRTQSAACPMTYVELKNLVNHLMQCVDAVEPAARQGLIQLQFIMLVMVVGLGEPTLAEILGLRNGDQSMAKSTSMFAPLGMIVRGRSRATRFVLLPARDPMLCPKFYQGMLTIQRFGKNSGVQPELIPGVGEDFSQYLNTYYLKDPNGEKLDVERVESDLADAMKQVGVNPFPSAEEVLRATSSKLLPGLVGLEPWQCTRRFLLQVLEEEDTLPEER